MIIIYTSETCPRCKILKKKMTDKNIPFVEEGNNYSTILELGMTELPVLQMDNTFMDYPTANNWVNSK